LRALPDPTYTSIVSATRALSDVISRTIDPSTLREIRSKLIRSWCLLERDFPLSEFTLITHEALHLLDAISQWGPVSNYWSYSPERFGGVLRGRIHSRKLPAEALRNAHDRILHTIESEDTETKVSYRATVGVVLPPRKSKYKQVLLEEAHVAEIAELIGVDCDPEAGFHDELPAVYIHGFQRKSKPSRLTQSCLFQSITGGRIGRLMNILRVRRGGEPGDDVVCRVCLFPAAGNDHKSGIPLVDVGSPELCFMRAIDVGRIVVLGAHPSSSPMYRKTKFVLFCTPDVL